MEQLNNSLQWVMKPPQENLYGNSAGVLRRSSDCGDYLSNSRTFDSDAADGGFIFDVNSAPSCRLSADSVFSSLVHQVETTLKITVKIAFKMKQIKNQKVMASNRQFSLKTGNWLQN